MNTQTSFDLIFLLFEKDFNPSFMDGSSRNKNDSVILDEKRPDICLIWGLAMKFEIDTDN